MATTTVTTWVDGAGGPLTFPYPGIVPSPGVVADLAPGGSPWVTTPTQGGAPEFHVAVAEWAGCPTATAGTVEITIDSFEYLTAATGGGVGVELLWAIADSVGAAIASGVFLLDSVGPGVYGPFTSGPISLTTAQIQSSISGVVLIDMSKPPKDVALEGGRLIIVGDIDACLTAADPVPVDNTASSTVGTAAVVDVSLNDDNTACDPLPGCAVYSTSVVVEPGSTAGGITASVDSAGVATVNATSAGTAIVTIESGCSPTCDPLGADVTTWVPQTLTVTFSEPAGPCTDMPLVFDQAATNAFAAQFGMDPSTDPNTATATAGVGSGQTALVMRLDIPPGCANQVEAVQVVSQADISAGMDPDNDGAGIIVASTLVGFPASWGTLSAASGDANIVIPGMVSTGDTSDGGTAWPAPPTSVTLDGTWSGGPAQSPIWVLLFVDAQGSSLPGSTIAIPAPTSACVTFTTAECPPVPTPKPADVVKLCIAAAPQAGCATFGGFPSPALFVAVSGPDGNVIPATSTFYPSNSLGGSDGNGYIRSYYTDVVGNVVTPDPGSWTPGSCGADALQLPAGAVSIADGVYAGTLGPNGLNWFPPAGLKSVTVYARHAATNDDATASGSPGRVEVFVNSNVFMLLDGESFTWSVDDPDELTTLTEVRCTADAAAVVTWVSA